METKWIILGLSLLTSSICGTYVASNHILTNLALKNKTENKEKTAVLLGYQTWSERFDCK